MFLFQSLSSLSSRYKLRKLRVTDPGLDQLTVVEIVGRDKVTRNTSLHQFAIGANGDHVLLLFIFMLKSCVHWLIGLSSYV